MVVSRKALLVATAIDVALFVIAFPLGDSHHGIGQHHSVAAHVGEAVWTTFLIGALAVIVLAAVALIQRTVRSRRSRP